MKIAELAVLFLVIARGIGADAGAQSASGTLVVIGWSRTKIAIAVDSRGYDDNEKYRDDICKIVRLGDHSVFTAAGNIIHAYKGRALWDAQKEALHAFKEARGTNSPRLLRTAARSWGDSMVTEIDQALQEDFTGSKHMLEKYISYRRVRGFRKRCYGDVSGGNCIRPRLSTGQTEFLYRTSCDNSCVWRAGAK